MLYLRIAIGALTLVAGIMSVALNLKNEKTKKLNKGGYWYIITFFILSSLSIYLDLKEDASQSFENKKNVTSIIDSTQFLLKNTDSSLKVELLSLNTINMLLQKNIDSSIKLNSAGFTEALKSQKNLRDLSNETVTNIIATNKKMSGLDTKIEKTSQAITKLDELSNKSFYSLEEITDNLENMNYPITPFQLEIRIEYKLSDEWPIDSLLKSNYLYLFDDWRTNIYSLNFVNNKDYKINDLSNSKEIIDFFDTYKLRIEFYTDSTLNLEKVYFSNLFYLEYCDCVKNTYLYNKQNLTLERSIKITFDSITINPYGITNLKELINNTYIAIGFSQSKKNDYFPLLSFKNSLLNKKNIKKDVENELKISIDKITVSKFVQLHYGPDLSITKSYFPNNIKSELENIASTFKTDNYLVIKGKL
jgi:uncharacterized alkaline shock family protein YloU